MTVMMTTTIAFHWKKSVLSLDFCANSSREVPFSIAAVISFCRGIKLWKKKQHTAQYTSLNCTYCKYSLLLNSCITYTSTVSQHARLIPWCILPLVVYLIFCTFYVLKFHVLMNTLEVSNKCFSSIASQEDLRNLVRFWVGWELPPSNLKVEVVTSTYPVALTCFHKLRLPDHYQNYQKFHQDLVMALKSSVSGFGLVLV